MCWQSFEICSSETDIHHGIHSRKYQHIMCLLSTCHVQKLKIIFEMKIKTKGLHIYMSLCIHRQTGGDDSNISNIAIWISKEQHLSGQLHFLWSGRQSFLKKTWIKISLKPLRTSYHISTSCGNIVDLSLITRIGYNETVTGWFSCTRAGETKSVDKAHN